jgi:ribosome-associated toxin RatA of RatAB toxin-antitoxin module
VALETIEREHVLPRCTPAQAYAVVVDYPSYPRVFPEFTACRVLESDGARRRVEFIAKVVVEVRYVLDIHQDDAAFTTRWSFVEGKVISNSVGGWRFTQRGQDTLVHYNAGIEVNAPLPGFVINKISKMLLGSSIPQMFRSLEREVAARHPGP